MTWIAACSSERGIHQETVITDEIEQLIERIERLAERITQLEKAVEALGRM